MKRLKSTVFFTSSFLMRRSDIHFNAYLYWLFLFKLVVSPLCLCSLFRSYSYISLWIPLLHCFTFIHVRVFMLTVLIMSVCLISYLSSAILIMSISTYEFFCSLFWTGSCNPIWVALFHLFDPSHTYVYMYIHMLPLHGFLFLMTLKIF